MSRIKQWLGLVENDISDSEIMQKLRNALKNDLDEVDFIKKDGTVVKVKFPHMKFDDFMNKGG